MTNIPPLNMRISHAFFLGAICAFQSIYIVFVLERGAHTPYQTRRGTSAKLTGSGIERRYMSVTTFSTTVKNKSIFEMAG